VLFVDECLDESLIRSRGEGIAIRLEMKIKKDIYEKRGKICKKTNVIGLENRGTGKTDHTLKKGQLLN